MQYYEPIKYFKNIVLNMFWRFLTDRNKVYATLKYNQCYNHNHGVVLGASYFPCLDKTIYYLEKSTSEQNKVIKRLYEEFINAQL